MKYSILKLVLCGIIMAAALAGCKNDDDGGDKGNNETADKVLQVLTVQDNAIQVYADELSSSQDTMAAINALAQWLLDQPEVDKAYYWGPDLIEVHYKNGLKSNILTVAADANGQHITRGGGKGNTFSKLSGPTGANAIKLENKKVLILNPFEESMYDGAYGNRGLFDSDYEVDIFNDDQVTYGLLNTLSDYGLIILNTHGIPNGFFLKKSLTLQPTEHINQLTREDILDLIVVQMGMPAAKFDNGELQFDMLVLLDGYSITHKYAMVNVTDKYLNNAPITLDKAVVFGNHCYSGYTAGPVSGNLPAAWRGKGAVAYYGYAFTNNSSGPVLNDYAKAWEDTLIINLVRGDSTGIANLENDITKMSHKVSSRNELPQLVARGLSFGAQPPIDLFFTHFFDDNYTFKSCGDDFVDSRDNKTYKTVCIGDQVWMAENLNWAGAGVCYDGNAANCNTYGRLYSLSEVANMATSDLNPSGIKGVCPDGWHVPSKAEWEELFTFCGGDAEAAIKLRSTTGWPTTTTYTDVYGFNMLPSGHDEMGFSQLGIGAKIWSCSYDASGDTYDAVNAYEPFLNIGGYSPPPDYEWKFSCRCVKD